MARGLRRRRALVALAAVALALVAGEVGLRRLVHARGPTARAWGWRVRRAQNFADPDAGRDYFKLKALLAGPAAERPNAHYHPLLGWLDPAVRPDYGHVDEAAVGDRRPVLLFGDSFAHCVTPAGECWQGLLERSELGPGMALLNYGVGGYGLGQVTLLLEQVLARPWTNDPLIVIGILVDDDLDRTYLSLRDAPKPRFELVAGELVLHPPAGPRPSDALAADPPEVTSYLWRYLVHGAGLFGREARAAWSPEADHVAVKEAVSARLLERIVADCRAHGRDFFFVLFHGRRVMERAPGRRWQEPFLLEELARLGVPYVSSRERLEAGARARGLSISQLFSVEGPAANHYTPAANELVFAALADGLRGRFDGPR